jgi:hypothetical protein
MFQNRLQPAVRWKRRGMWSSGVSAAWQDPTSCSRRTAKHILDLKMQVLPLSAIFARFSTRRFSPLWHVKDSVRGRHFRSDEEVNVAEQDWLVRTATERLLLLWNLSLSGRLGEVYRRWCILHWRLTSLYCTYVWYTSLGKLHYMYYRVYRNHRIAAILSALKIVCLWYIILNSLYKGNNTYNSNNNYNINNIHTTGLPIGIIGSAFLIRSSLWLKTL